MIGGMLSLNTSLFPMVIVDPKNLSSCFYKIIANIPWSKYPANNSSKQREIF